MCSEQERTLEELGGQLSAAKLAAAELREAADNVQQQQQQSALQEGSVAWANDRMVTQCKGCSREFNMTRRKVIKLFNCPHAFSQSSRPSSSCLLLSHSLTISLLLSVSPSLPLLSPLLLFLFLTSFPSQPRFLRLLRESPFPSPLFHFPPSTLVWPIYSQN